MDWPDRIGRRIKLRELHILLAIVQSGSITKAAEQLAISQPVVSKVIANLEQVLGVRLDRDRHGAQATICGAALLKRGIAACDELKQGVKEIEFLKGAAGGELRLGVSAAMVEGLLPAILNRLQRDHPLLTIDIIQGSTGPALYRELRDRNVDLIVGRMACQSTTISRLRCYSMIPSWLLVRAIRCFADGSSNCAVDGRALDSSAGECCKDRD
jgi:DNA-binding transcriptional LysR family regulator